jgi:hypothetical protein
MGIISYLNQVPTDIIWCIGLQLTVRDFAVLLQVSRTFNQLLSQIYADIARDGRAHARIQSEVIPLNAWQVAEQWGQLTPVEARALRIDLRARPHRFYSRIIDPAMVLLQEKFLTQRNDQTALFNLALGHLNLRQAAILASRISDKDLRATAIHTIVERAIEENLSESMILEFVSSLVTADMPLERIKKIIRKIPGSSTKKRDRALHALALKNGIKIGKAVSIALLIQKPGKRLDALYDIARRDEIAPEDIAYIMNFVEDPFDIPLLIKIEKMGYYLSDTGDLIKKPKKS